MKGKAPLDSECKAKLGKVKHLLRYETHDSRRARFKSCSSYSSSCERDTVCGLLYGEMSGLQSKKLSLNLLNYCCTQSNFLKNLHLCARV